MFVVNHKNAIDLYMSGLVKIAVYIRCQPHILYVRALVHHPCMFVVRALRTPYMDTGPPCAPWYTTQVSGAQRSPVLTTQTEMEGSYSIWEV